VKKERYFRCSCCNKVASEDIASDIFELNTSLYFRIDPRDSSKMYCSECIEQIQQTLFDFSDEVVFQEDEE